MYIHTLHFRNGTELSWAFERLVACEHVEDCLVEPEELRIRFVAPRDATAPLIEKFYLRGGLTWSTRVRFPTKELSTVAAT